MPAICRLFDVLRILFCAGSTPRGRGCRFDHLCYGGAVRSLFCSWHDERSATPRYGLCVRDARYSGWSRTRLLPLLLGGILLVQVGDGYGNAGQWGFRGA